MTSIGGTDEAILNSVNLPVAKFNLCISSVCHLALFIENKVDRQATGFLAKFSLNGSQKIVVVMNNHFVAERENASKIEATFKFEGRTDIKSVKLDPDIFFRTNKDLDYTFVGISQENVTNLREKYRVTPMKLDETRLAVQPNEVIHIPQHPGGKSKQISFSTIYKITDTEVFYKADTSSGSSGSPVLYCQSNEMYVLALHKSGGVTLDGILTNRGILIAAILDHIGLPGDIDEKPTDVQSEGSNGSRESGVYIDTPTTTHGLPIVQTQSAQNEPDTPTDSVKPSSLTQETENPCSKASDSDSSKSPTTSVQPSPPSEEPPQASQVDVVSTRPFEPKELIRIAQRIADVWYTIAKFLNFKHHEVAIIECNLSLPEPTMKADRMLTMFKSRLGKRGELAEAIKEARRDDLAAKVRSAFYIDNTD